MKWLTNISHPIIIAPRDCGDGIGGGGGIVMIAWEQPPVLNTRVAGLPKVPMHEINWPETLM